MNNIKRFTLTLATLLLFSGVALVGPVAAHGGENSDDSSQTKDESPDLTHKFMERARDRLKTESRDGFEQKQEKRQKSCEARKTSLTKKMNRAVAHAQKHKAVFDKIYTRVKEFHDNKNLNVPDYDTLTAAVDTAQTNAQANIDALKALDVSVDCTSETVAEKIGAFREAVKSTRDSLKDYRKALVDLINSLKGASTGTDSDSTESTNGAEE